MADTASEEEESSSVWPWRSKSEREKKVKKEKVKKEKAEKKEGGFITKMEDMFGNIFSEDDE